MANTASILDDFDAKEQVFRDFEKRTSLLLHEVISSNNVVFSTIQARTKARGSLERKCQRPDKNYQHLTDITDIVAFRIITYFEDDVDKVADVLNKSFTVDQQRSVDKRTLKPTEFGYSALHAICQYTENRSALPENQRFAGIWWEVQVCSMLQHAWNEIEHDIGYKSTAPVTSDIQRRLHRIAAALELIDSEFKEVRNKAKNYRLAVGLTLESGDYDSSDLLVDSISIVEFAKQDEVVAKAATLLSNRFNLPIQDGPPESHFKVALAGLQELEITTLQQLRNALSEVMEILPDYVDNSVKLFEGAGIVVTFEYIRKETVISNFVTYLIGLRGGDALASLYKATGAYGVHGEQFARLQAAAVERCEHAINHM